MMPGLSELRSASAILLHHDALPGTCRPDVYEMYLALSAEATAHSTCFLCYRAHGALKTHVLVLIPFGTQAIRNAATGIADAIAASSAHGRNTAKLPPLNISSARWVEPPLSIPHWFQPELHMRGWWSFFRREKLPAWWLTIRLGKLSSSSNPRPNPNHLVSYRTPSAHPRSFPSPFRRLCSDTCASALIPVY